MISLEYADEQENVIKKIVGDDETKESLKRTGLFVGATIRIVHSDGGNLILDVRGEKVAVSKETAELIFV